MATPRVWPLSILRDSDVLRLDDRGRFVVCRVCWTEYAVYGGEEAPDCVDMELPFFTHAWAEHKRLQHNAPEERDLRTRSRAETVIEVTRESTEERELLNGAVVGGSRSPTGESPVDPRDLNALETASQNASSGSKAEAACVNGILGQADVPAVSSRKRLHRECAAADEGSPESLTSRRSALYWQTMREVFSPVNNTRRPPSARLKPFHDRLGSPATKCQHPRRGLIRAFDELTRTLANREEDEMTLRLAEAKTTLQALRSAQQRANARMIRSQERSLEQLLEIARPAEQH